MLQVAELGPQIFFFFRLLRGLQRALGVHGAINVGSPPLENAQNQIVGFLDGKRLCRCKRTLYGQKRLAGWAYYLALTTFSTLALS